MTEMRKCIGSAKFGIEGHEAPVGDFPSQPSQKDGLGRMCRPHWTEYVRALARARRARLAAAPAEAIARAARVAEVAEAAAEHRKGREAQQALRAKLRGKVTRFPKPEPIRTRPARKATAIPQTGSQGDAG